MVVMGNKGNRCGVSLVEVITAVAVLGIAIPPVVSMFTEVARHSPDDLYQGAAIHAANSLMEEIVSKPFEDPDLPTGSFGAEEPLRRQYDDIDDFDGYSNAPDALGPLVPAANPSVTSTATAGPTAEDADATIFTNAESSPYGGITLTVSVDNVSAAETDPTVPQADGSTHYKRITVGASWDVGDGGEVRFKTLRTNLPLTLVDAGPLDEQGSAGSVISDTPTSFELVLVNPTNDPLEISTVKVEADRETPPLTQLRFSQDYGPMQFGWMGIAALPTDDLALYLLAAPERTVAPMGFLEVRAAFQGKVAPGPIIFTVTYTFSDGTKSVLIMPMELL